MIYLLYPRASLYTRSEAPTLRFKERLIPLLQTIHERPFSVSIAHIAGDIIVELLRRHPSRPLSHVVIGRPQFEVVREIAEEGETPTPA